MHSRWLCLPVVLLFSGASISLASADSDPSVISTRPGHGETAVDPGSPIVVVFSEPMDRLSAEAAFSLNPTANGSFSWAGDAMLFSPTGGLSNDIWYGAAVSAGARSLSGGSLPAPVFFGFLTSPRAASSFAVTGIVRDEQGAGIAAIAVEALHSANGTRAGITFSDASGGFRISLASQSSYRLRVGGGEWETKEVDAIADAGDYQVSLRPSRPAAGGGPGPLVFVVGAATGGMVLASLLLIEAFRFALFSVAASMMMRVRRDQVLDQFVRGQVFGAVVLKPGINYTEIRKSLRIANGQLAYHLHVLLREEFVISRRVGAHTSFYPAGVAVDIGAGMRLSPLQERIVEMLRGSPGISQTDLAARLHRPVKTVHYNVTRLQRLGIMRVERAGKGSACFAVGPPPAPPRQVDVTAI